MGDEEGCISYCEQLLRLALGEAIPDVAKLSIALGVVEHSLTPRDESRQVWPSDLPGTVAALDAAFEAWVGDLAGAPALAAANSPAAKVKAVADAVWSRLNKGAFSKDLQHAQHVFCFAALLAPDVVPGVKKQLDCAGVVTTAYAACHALSRRFSQHRDLAAARMQVSEDHCWVQLGGASVREASVEVTTDTAAKRGLPVAADAWAGWLYSGGHAVLCSPHQALAALVTSINPSISGGRQGRDSGELQEVQRRLLQVLLQQQPTALYPAALCALADLLEVEAQDALEAALSVGDEQRLAGLLARTPGDTQDLFEAAIALASGADSSSVLARLRRAAAEVSTHATKGCVAGSGSPAVETAADGGLAVEVRQQDSQQPPSEPQQQQRRAEASAQPCHGAPANGHASTSADGITGEHADAGWQWYVHSYLAGFLARRAEFLGSCSAVFGQQFWHAAEDSMLAALRAAARGGAVLARYRFSPSTDEQLFKDVQDVLEQVAWDGLSALAKQRGGQLADPTSFTSLLLLWEGVCHLYAGRAKPSNWVALLLKAAKLFSPEAREAAAAAVDGRVTSGPMQAARQLWRALKPVQVRPLFESADVGRGDSGSGERAAKRQRQ